MAVRDLLQAAITMKGSQRALGDACGYTQVAICKALRRGKVTAEMAIAIEGATGIDRKRLCPEVFGQAVTPRPSRQRPRAEALP